MGKTLEYHLKSYKISMSERDFLGILLTPNLEELDDLELKSVCTYNKIAKTLIAMSNTRGGIMILGVEDANENQNKPGIIGIPENSINQYIDKTKVKDGLEPYILPKLLPSIHHKVYDYRHNEVGNTHPLVDGKIFVVFNVTPDKKDLPYYPKKAVEGNITGLLVRRGASCVLANEQDIERIFEDRLSVITDPKGLNQDIEDLELLCSHIKPTTPFNINIRDITNDMYTEKEYSFNSIIKELIKLKKSRIISKI